jgi:multifunctional 2-oxoglutarate metabolism enzyme
MSTFGLNSAYINDLYYEYLKNPGTFDPTWQAFFAQYDPASEDVPDELIASVAPAAPARQPEPAPAATQPPPTNGTNGQTTQPAPRTEPAPQPAPEAAPSAKKSAPVPEGARELRSVALRIAQNMELSLTVPTATSFREIPVKLLEENRTLINGYLKAVDEGKLSFTHIIGWALVRAAQQFPSLNNGYFASDGKAYLVERADVNLGLAIDLARPDGGRSLVVPSIKGANRMDFRQFFETYEDLVQKARGGKLGPDDFMGTTITLTNPGTIGTIASVPRLMMGQGTIIATGAINYPAAYQAMDAETLSELGISKVMEMTSTYDHRIIQGAESGMFLQKVHEYLTGGDGFYDDIFRSLRIPYRPLAWQRDRNPALFGNDRTEYIQKQQAVMRMITSYRVRGHLQAHLDPLGREPIYHEELDPAQYGLTIWDFDRTFMTGGVAGLDKANLRTILQILRDTYTQRIGVEYMHIQDRDQKTWLREQMESSRNQPKLSKDQKRRVLLKLSEAEIFEKFLQTKYTGHKRFSLEGSETMIPMLDELVSGAARTGAKEVFFGMAHRGRLNVLANILGKSAQKIFAEFEDIRLDPNSVQGSGDVKYHLGERATVTVDGTTRLNIWLAPNPSHLEAVDPIVEGMTRARQDRSGENRLDEFVPVLIHGDAAFAGQGVVAETFNMSQLAGYHTGGTIHLVVNNQIGFTASPADTKSGVYATDVAKSVQAPIFHVNGDDPEAAVYVMRLALEYRQRFHRDVVVDLICYRRHGHNETDEPGFTNPLLYRRIKEHPPIHVVYTQRLVRNGTLSTEEAEAMEQELRGRLEMLLAATKAVEAPRATGDPLADQQVNPLDPARVPQTGAPEFMLEHVINVLSTVPSDVDVHPKLARQIEARRKAVEEGKIDWALAESFAIGTLLLEGHPVRLSGQDSKRGTFSQRHAVVRDQQTGADHVQLNHLSETQATFHVFDSPLSEYAVLGFEYGYSVVDPGALVLWEAQFGDFVNGAQIIIDQFISSGEDKWGQQSSVALLLPHGFEGQGPEHSSARLERFLTLCAEDNMVVVYPSTAAQYFHLLRTQAKREPRKPLVVMTPKSLLRDPLVASSVAELTTGVFRRVIGETDQIDPLRVKRVVLCTGKTYYDMLKTRRKSGVDDVAIVRIEQLYPFPAREVREILATYRNANDVLWVQEEPKNMGAWPAISHWIMEVLGTGQRLAFLGRPASGSPAAGSGRTHKTEQEEIVRRALGMPDAPVELNKPPTGAALPES